MTLASEMVLSLPAEVFESTHKIKEAIFRKWSCTVSDETAKRIYNDFHKQGV